ncbi:MFS transporter [Ligilactobacillus murinus]|uniref:Galactoside permease n=2 Tax=Ligilactobacillus murinus TaxID=1622 RepID=A0A0R2B9L6_9LACO|nr:MFS transporter [Ligilactobacillus murinus]NBH87011.1 MFS transporter [Lachnospiraceae bacterium]HAB49981.1 MFS transporter [Lactobacillus sp.]KRM76191.1 galactoside permease [Ligilactobacillus murinus DSM 20452 = NBRC 14221]MBF0701792.1 MFS transporter [Ligilactobacillus murinus]MCR1881292.1 MFS transporter [Ligilactobacillus murinus]
MELQRKLRELKNPSYLQSSTTMLLFFASWGIWWSFFQLWLTSEHNGLGLSGSAVGTIFSINSIASLVLMFLYGTIQDKLFIKRHLLIFNAILATLIAPFFIFVYAPLLQSHFIVGAWIGAIFLSAAYLSAVGVLEATTERFSRVFGFAYGQARAWGSFGYAISALLAGFLFVKDPRLNFIGGSLIGICLLLDLLFWRPKEERAALKAIDELKSDDATPKLKDMVGLLKIKVLWQIIFFVMFSWTFYNVFDQQMFPEFYTSLFSSNAVGQQTYGTLNSIQVFVEALMLGLVPLLMKKIGVRKTLLLGTAIMCLRIGLCGFITDPIVISGVKMLHSLEVPLFVLSIFRYFTLHFDTKLSATLYMIGFQIAAQVGQVILSTPLGILRDNMGYSMTFKIIALIVLLTGIYGFFIIKKDNEFVNGQPLEK